MPNRIRHLKTLQRSDMKFLISTTHMPRLEILLKDKKVFESVPIKVIVNSTEWEITIHSHDFEEFWMSYATGRV